VIQYIGLNSKANSNTNTPLCEKYLEGISLHVINI
jgi:hypothetical protein